MNTYHQQVSCTPQEIDLDFWKSPEGVSVPDDELRFLLIPDAVEAMATFDLSQQVHRYQQEQLAEGSPITSALLVTMGGMLPGILLHDHLVAGRPPGTPKIEFGTIGVSLYKGPGERYDEPRVQHGISIPMSGATVLAIDDLGDSGETMQFLTRYIAAGGAKQVLNLALYMKPAAKKICPANFWFGDAEQDTWIITPREYVETMAKRVPVWRERGADQRECYRRLVEIIGYPRHIVDYYLPALCGQGAS